MLLLEVAGVSVLHYRTNYVVRFLIVFTLIVDMVCVLIILFFIDKFFKVWNEAVLFLTIF